MLPEKTGRSVATESSSPSTAGPLIIVMATAAPERAVFSHWALSQGFRTLKCDGSTQLRNVLLVCEPALVILSEDPDHTVDCVLAIRAIHPHVPIVCLTQSSNTRRILAAGATDFFLRPYQIDELLDRFDARVGTLDPEESGPDTVGRTSGCVRLQGKPIPLRTAARRILCYLCDHAGRAVPVAELQDRVLQMKGRSHTVHNHVYEIRKALKAAGLPNFIQTHKGAGCFSVPTHLVQRLHLAAPARKPI